MGMLGAMAGLGQGMQNFSQMLNEKAKMDWMEQKDAVLFERQKNLEQLRQTHAEGLQKSNQEWQSGRDTANQEFTANQQASNQEWQSGRDNKQIASQYDLENLRNTNDLKKIGAQQAAQIANTKAVLELTDTFEKGKEKENIAQLEKNPLYIEAPDNFKALMRMQIEDPKSAAFVQAMLSSEKGVPITVRDVVASKKESESSWAALGEKGQEALQVSLGSKEAPLPLEQTKSLYIRRQLEQDKADASSGKPGVLSRLSTMGAPASKGVESTVPTKQYDLQAVAQAIKGGKITMEQAGGTLGDDQFLELSKILRGSSRAPASTSAPNSRMFENNTDSALSRSVSGMSNATNPTIYDIPVVGRVASDFKRRQEGYK